MILHICQVTAEATKLTKNTKIVLAGAARPLAEAIVAQTLCEPQS